MRSVDCLFFHLEAPNGGLVAMMGDKLGAKRKEPRIAFEKRGRGMLTFEQCILVRMGRGRRRTSRIHCRKRDGNASFDSAWDLAAFPLALAKKLA